MLRIKSYIISVFVLFSILAHAEIKINGDGCAIKTTNGGVDILDIEGSVLLTLSGVSLSWAPQKTKSGNTSKLNDNTIKIDYNVVNDKTGKVKISGIFSCQNHIVTAKYTVTAPKGVNIGGTMYIRKKGKIEGSPKLVKLGKWVRHKHGGVPYEVKDITFRRFNGKNSSVFETINGNVNWVNTYAQHISLKKTGEDTYTGETKFIILPSYTTNEAAGAVYSKRPISLALATNRDFNLWDNKERPEFNIRLTNTSGKQLAGVRLKVFVRDYDGKLIKNSTNNINLDANEEKSINIKIPARNEHEFYFAEASAKLNGKEVFARTMLAVMPDYEYKYKDTSIFGIAAYFDIPSQKAVDKLLKRMGIRWVRNGDTRKTMPAFGALSNYHSNIRPEQWKNTPKKRTDWAKKGLERCRLQQNVWWEFGNEWNMGSLNSGKKADIYVKNWLSEIYNQKKAGNYKVKIMSMGLAGADLGFLKAIHKNGGWNMMDGIAYHSGRGNLTPDYDNARSYWSFYGPLKAIKKTVKQLGNKPIWITEAYACTKPNNWWYDSYRRAAENIVLQFALAKAEGIAGVMFYQLQDSRWTDKGGINSKDSEYSYGILFRDGTVKPSLSAFCTISEALDGAKFVKFLKFKNKYLKGILFKKPEGQMAIIWNRKDGYVQANKADNYAEPEPWIDHWKSVIPVALPTKGSKITVTDCVGRKRVIKSQNRRVRITTTGAPIIITGTNF